MLAKTAFTKEMDRMPEAQPSVYDQALSLARAIETLLESAAAQASAPEGYGLRLSEAMTRSLIAQLADLKRSRAA